MAANTLLLSFLLFTSVAAVYGAETLNSHPPAVAPLPPPPPPPPHHHNHTHPPTPPPSHPPTPPPSHPPTPPPSHPPVKPPATPPSYPPVKPPTPPPQRKKVAVQGVVYCKSCKYRGVNTLVGASPLSAVVKLQCNNTKKGFTEQLKTDKNGYFFFMPQNLTSSGSHKCKVSLVSSPLKNCTVPTNLHAGAVGAILFGAPKPPPVVAPAKPPPLVIFTVGPFAFDAPKKFPCHY